jgi:hypothetical protein
MCTQQFEGMYEQQAQEQATYVDHGVNWEWATATWIDNHSVNQA